jgi:predicted ATPase
MGVLEYMNAYGVPGYGERDISKVSHGEGYVQVLLGRFKGQGLYLLDEPEAALSFESCLLLIKQLQAVVQNGAQVICATHSPIITALPGADILEVGEHGIHRKTWDELELTRNWKKYLSNPQLFLDSPQPLS